MSRETTADEFTPHDRLDRVSFSINDSSDPAVIIDRKHRIVGANGPFLVLFQFPPDELDGQHVIHELVPEKHRAQHQLFVDSLFRSPQVRSMSDPKDRVVGVKRDGTTFPARVSFFPHIVHEAGEEICVGYTACVVERTSKTSPLLADWHNWVAALMIVIGGIGFLMEIEGATEWITWALGLRMGMESKKLLPAVKS